MKIKEITMFERAMAWRGEGSTEKLVKLYKSPGADEWNLSL
jgi:aryl carrier-like protein